MKNKTLQAILISLLVVVLLIGSFGSGFIVGHFTGTGTSTGGTSASLTQLFTPFWKAWDIIHQDYVDQPVNDTALMQGAINGMVNSLGDAHTLYLNPQDYTDATSLITGNYAGIGALVDTSGSLLTITKPFADSPAEKAGLQAGDQIIAIDGQDVTNQLPEAVRQKVLGKEGTTVTLTIQRPGVDKPFDETLTRAIITVPSVTSKMLDGQIAYLEISTFGDSTARDVHDQLAALLAQNPKGLILDLRYDSGGLLDAAVAIASEFIPSGVIVTEKAGDGTLTTHKAIPGGLATSNSLPMIVLVNGYSASASEIVAGALQDTGRAKLLGETTYGKGTAQLWIPLSGSPNDNQGAVAVTIARWLTPDGRTIDKEGLTPDIVVQMTTDDFKAGKDPQLDAAVKQLTSG